MIRKALYAGTTILVGLVALAGTKARADVITTYTLQGSTTGGEATVVGSFQIDQTTFNVSTQTGVSVTSPFTVTNDNITADNGTYKFFSFLSNALYFDNTMQRATTLTLDFPFQTVMESISNGTLIFPKNAISFTELTLQGGSVVNYFPSNFEIAVSTPTSVPEPSTLAILASGVLGIVGLGRRRMRINPGQ